MLFQLAFLQQTILSSNSSPQKNLHSLIAHGHSIESSEDFAQHHGSAPTSMQSLCPTADDSPVRTPILLTLTTKPSTFLRTANMQFSLLLETKDGLRLELHNRQTFKISAISTPLE